MRRYDRIVQLEKGIVSRNRLLLGDIKPRHCDLPVRQRLDKRLLVDDGAAGGVHKHGGWFHQPERFLIEDMAGAFIQRAMD